MAVLVVTAIAVLVVILTTSGGGQGRRATRATAARARVAVIPAVESGLLPWSLPAPVSREVVLPGGGNSLIVLGGLNGSSSASGVFSLDSASGALRSIGALRTRVHDAAGAILAGREIVFGGGSPATVATVDAFPSSAPTPGSLPAPRSDAAAASIGDTAYIVGGYTGSAADPSVLATTDGTTFRTVATLRVPVRYPAVAAVAGKLYVFGGEAISGPDAGKPVDDIQVIDPSRRSVSIAGHLPAPLEAAAAVVLGGAVYVVGGDTTAPQPSVAGAGTTQTTPPPAAGSAGVFTTPGILAFDPSSRRVLAAGRLQVPVSHAGVAVLGSRAWVVGGESNGRQIAAVQMLTPNRSFGVAGAAGAGSPYFGGRLLIADRGNNRLLVLDSSNRIVWSFPSRSSPPDRFGFFFPDDAFFVRHGTAIVSNQEENETIEEIGFPSGRVLWHYGHKGESGSAPGYLHEPDDAYLLKDGQITVADAQNCRVLVIDPDHRIADQIGTASSCVHNPPASIGSPNGDTPLANGNLLVSEVQGSWVSEFTPAGHLVWSVKLPIAYPSDPQQLGANLYLLADYTTPGEILEFNRAGKILYRYDVASGPGMLNQPSLTELLPSGVLMANDDYRNRMVAIDPATKALVWQYGITDRAGTAPGMLKIPDGFDILMANGSTPTHLATG